MWISTTKDSKWTERNVISGKADTVLTLGKPSGKPLYGFGCCFSEICAREIFGLGEEAADGLFRELFSPGGCGFNYCRLSIGANDFAVSWYSYDETDGDYELKDFSIDRDRKYILPAIKKAQKYSPELRFFASPWSPPTWMKEPKVNNFGTLVRTKENMTAYARYFRKYLEAYAAEGVKVGQVHFQNEFFSSQKFPSCTWDGDTIREFIGEYLGPEISDIADIWYGTDNGPETDARLLTSRHNQFMNYVMRDEKCRSYIKGASFQWAGKFGITQAAEDYPDLDLINGEGECGDGTNSWDYAMYTYEMMHHYYRFGAKATVYWNMALAEGGLSTWGWRQNSLITVKDGKASFTPEFYLMKHFSHFVKRGAEMVPTVGDYSSNTTVFRNPDGTYAAVIVNPFRNEYTVEIAGKAYTMLPESFNTVTF